MSNPPSHLAHGIVVVELHCRKCGYDLRSLRADGACPECGMQVWLSVQHAVDPAASRLPSIRNPKAVGDALVALTGVMLVGAILLSAPPVLDEIDAWDPAAVRRWSDWAPTFSWWWAGSLTAITLWAILRLAPPIGKESVGAVWMDVARFGAGLVGFLWLAAVFTHHAEAPGEQGARTRLLLHACAGLSAMLSLLGLRGVLEIIGKRSGEYGRSRSGRHGVEALFAAIAVSMVGAAMQYLTVRRLAAEVVGGIGTLLVWASMLMLVIGLAYLVMNAWWIRTALRRGPSSIDQVLLPPLDDDTSIPET